MAYCVGLVGVRRPVLKCRLSVMGCLQWHLITGDMNYLSFLIASQLLRLRHAEV